MTNDEIHWINPIGGLGDMLMVSGVLKQAIDQNPEKRFNLIRRTNYTKMFEGHPAIETIGSPPKNAKIKDVTYWSMEELGTGEKRPYQILARAFGLETPVKERLFFPRELVDDNLLHDIIPWTNNNIVIAPSSDSPRKVMKPKLWHNLVDLLRRDGMLVMQVGRTHEQHIRNTYSLLGLTTPGQLLFLLKKCDIVITSDNFIMHAAHLVNTKAVVIWGPTRSKIYGYPEQIHLQVPKKCGLSEDEGCIGAGKNKGGKIYASPCPMGDHHCLDQIKPGSIYRAVKKNLMD